jgi:hypothetical protein
LQVILNRRDKEQLVIKLHQEGKTIREIAQKAHMSFTDIGVIIRKIDGQDDDETKDLKNKSKETRALHLFLHGKRPVDVAIELDLSSSEVENMLQEFWVLNQLDELALVYHEIKNHLDLFLRLFHIMKKNRLINQKDLQTILKHTGHDLPSLENKLYALANNVIDLEIKKKEMNAQLFDLGQAITQYQNIIDSKKYQLMELDKQLAIQRGKPNSDKALE